MMRAPPPERWKRRVFAPWRWPLVGGGSVPHHEAGHLVIARALGLPAYGASVFEGGGAAYLINMPESESARREGHAQILSPDADHERIASNFLHIAELALHGISAEESAARVVSMLCAGAQAELIHAEIPIPADAYLAMRDPDHIQAELILRKSGVSLGWAQRQARYLLTMHWGEVDAIARTLNQEKVIRLPPL